MEKIDLKKINEQYEGDLEELIEGLSDDEGYNDFLDTTIDDIDVGNLTFQPSRIISELDPIAYRVGKSEYISELYEDDCLKQDALMSVLNRMYDEQETIDKAAKMFEESTYY